MEPKDNTSGQTIIYNERKKRYIHKNLDPSTVVLLEKESTMDLLYNPDLVEYIKKMKVLLRIQSNGREIYVNQKTNIPG